MKWLVAAAVAILAIVAAVVAFPGDDRRPTREQWTDRVQDAARVAAVAGPVPPSLAGGSAARAYAICYDLSLRKDRPADCRLSSAFVFASGVCSIDYRGLDVPYHEACALECADGCFVLDGLFAGTIGCAEWRDALTGGKTGCNYELRNGIRLGPDDPDGSPSQAERDAAHVEIEARRSEESE